MVRAANITEKPQHKAAPAWHTQLSEAGTIGGRYQLDAIVGHGAMGQVVRAHDTLTDKAVALKRFRLEDPRQDEDLRFRREFHTLARLRHPRIVEVYDYGVDKRGRPFYAMELLDGRDLSELAPVPWHRACELLRDVASALAFLHARQLLHRDIAPRNVRCTDDGRAKLLDFGMLSTMGVSHEVVGTLPAIAPEMLLGLPMDGRADLFGLGALAFWLLTGRHPQQIRSLDDLMRNGRKPAPPPSSLVPAIPPALDDLVLSLLSAEPLGRPAQAAEVIDRVAAIAELPAAPELPAAHSYIRSAAMVGREREMELARTRIERTIEGRGGALVIDGPSGMGKTRLLREIELEAKLASAIVLHAEAASVPRPYALVHALARQLEHRDGPRDDGHHAALIDRLLPDNTSPDADRRSGRDPREERAEVQAAFSDWLVAFATHRPLVLVLDELQRADEASAAVLAGLAHIAPNRSLLLVAAMRSDERSRADGALNNLRERAVVLHPRSLRLPEVQQLVRNTFGEADNHASFAAWLHRAARGSPLHCTELIRGLVDRDELRYVQGLWVIPPFIDMEGPPHELEQTLDERVARLEDAALQLGQALAVHNEPTELPLCIALVPDCSEAQVFAAVDTLVREEVIIGADERYRLRHDGLRHALLRTIEGPHRQRLERHVGETLAGDDAIATDRKAKIGWHLLRGGDDERGADLLFEAGRRQFDATSFEDCVAPLEAALAVFETHGTRPRDVAKICFMLVCAGFYCDREVNRRHRERAFAVLSEQAGVDRAARWSRWVGRPLALVTAIFVVSVRRLLDRKTRLPLLAAYDMFLRSVVYSAGTAGFSFDTQSLRRCNALLDPLRPISQVFVRTAVSLVSNLLAFNLGRLSTVMKSSARNLAGMSSQRRWLSAEERAMTIGGSRFQRALVAARVGNPRALDEIEALEKVGPRIWAIGGLQLRTYYHLWRGESAAAGRSWAQAELESVRLGALWQLYSIHHSSSAITYAFTDDMLGLRRCIEALRGQVETGLGFEVYLRLARSEHARLGGDYDEALALVDEAIAALPPHEGLPRPWALSARADILRKAGRLDDARTACAEAIALAEDPEHGQSSFRFRSRRCLALVEAEAGNVDEAIEQLSTLTSQAEELGNPYISGAAHEAFAKVLAASGNEAAAREHAAEVERWFVPTRNPVLVARCERLQRSIGLVTEVVDPSETDGHSGEVPTIVFNPATTSDTIATALTAIGECRSAAERAEHVMHTLCRASGVTEGFVYILRDGQPTLVAPSAGAEPPTEVRELATAKVTITSAEAQDEEHTQQRAGTGFVGASLLAEIDGHQRCVGVFVLCLDRSACLYPAADLRRALGQRLYEEGDVSLGREPNPDK